jgi:hypothetical protein
VVFEILTEVVSVTRERGISEVMSPSDSSTTVLYKWSVDIFVRFSLQKLFSIFLLS